MFLGETHTMCFVTGATQVHGVNVWLYTLTTRLRRDCATTVQEKKWCAVGVSVYPPPPVDCQEIKFPESEMTSLNNLRRKNNLLFKPG